MLFRLPRRVERDAEVRAMMNRARRMTFEGRQTRVETAIVGGGVAGLFLASRLPNAVVFERRSSVGGKVRTTYADGRPIFEHGPWRLHTSHRRALALCARYGLDVADNRSSRAASTNNADQRPCNENGTSTFGDRMFRDGIDEARRADAATGYEGLHEGDCRANAYHAQKGGPKDGTYKYVRNGMRAIVDALAKDVGSSRIRTEAHVVDIARCARTDSVCYRLRLSDDTYVVCDRVILCAPPHQLSLPSIDRYLRDVFACVRPMTLMHVWARAKRPIEPPIYDKLPHSFLAQIISGDHPMYFQISYSAERTARAMHELHLAHPDRFRRRVIDEFNRVKRDDIEIDPTFDLRVCYHECAIHIWRPAKLRTPEERAERCVEPHAYRLPRLYVATEAFSSVHQGWIEGSLEMCERVLRRIQSEADGCPIRTKKTLDAEEIVLADRVIRIGEFRRVHPGGAGVFDDSDAFERVGHPPGARAVVFDRFTGYYYDEPLK